jgi:hypothetical protein
MRALDLATALGVATALGLASTAAMATVFSVSSADIRDGGTVPMAQVFNADGCTGRNRSPQLTWSGEPTETRSFAVTMFDPDAPTGHGWWHWTMFDIPATVHTLPENAGAERSGALPAGAEQGRNDFGFSQYGGPCPPVGDKPHRYVITVYALNRAKLPLEAGASGTTVDSILRAAAIASVHLTGRYGRPH